MAIEQDTVFIHKGNNLWALAPDGTYENKYVAGPPDSGSGGSVARMHWAGPLLEAASTNATSGGNAYGVDIRTTGIPRSTWDWVEIPAQWYSRGFAREAPNGDLYVSLWSINDPGAISAGTFEDGTLVVILDSGTDPGDGVQTHNRPYMMVVDSSTGVRTVRSQVLGITDHFITDPGGDMIVEIMATVGVDQSIIQTRDYLSDTAPSVVVEMNDALDAYHDVVAARTTVVGPPALADDGLTLHAPVSTYDDGNLIEEESGVYVLSLSDGVISDFSPLSGFDRPLGLVRSRTGGWWGYGIVDDSGGWAEPFTYDPTLIAPVLTYPKDSYPWGSPGMGEDDGMNRVRGLAPGIPVGAEDTPSTYPGMAVIL